MKFLFIILLAAQTFAQNVVDPYRYPTFPLQGLLLRYEMDAQTHLTNGLRAAPINDSVSSYNLIELANGNLTPVFYTNLLAGHSVVRFDPVTASGNQSVITNIPGISIDGITIGIVVKTTANPSFGSQYFWIMRFLDTKFTLQNITDGGNIIYSFESGLLAPLVTVTNSIDTWQVITAQWAASDGVPSIKNNNDTVTGSAGTAAISSIDYVQFQSARTNTYAEIAVWTNKISAANLAQARRYWLSKYGISGTP